MVLYGVFIVLRILLCHLLFFDTCYLVLLNAFFSPAKLFDAFLVKVMIAFEYLYIFIELHLIILEVYPRLMPVCLPMLQTLLSCSTYTVLAITVERSIGYIRF